MNFGFSLPNPNTKQDICALSGRIIHTSEGVEPCGTFLFGGSDHIASIILAVTRTYPKLRSALNIHYSPEILKYCEQTDLSISSFDREQQPKTVPSTMDWGTSIAIKQTSKPPDLVYDTGSIGKEPMIRILGIHPQNVILKLKKIIKLYYRRK